MKKIIELFAKLKNKAIVEMIQREKNKAIKETEQRLYAAHEQEKQRMNRRHMFKLSLLEADNDSLKREIIRLKKDMESFQRFDDELKRKQETFLLISEKLNSLCDSNVHTILRYYQDTKNVIKQIEEVGSNDKKRNYKYFK